MIKKVEEILEKINEVKKEVDKLPPSREKSLVHGQKKSSQTNKQSKPANQCRLFSLYMHF